MILNNNNDINQQQKVVNCIVITPRMLLTSINGVAEELTGRTYNFDFITIMTMVSMKVSLKSM